MIIPQGTPKFGTLPAKGVGAFNKGGNYQKHPDSRYQFVFEGQDASAGVTDIDLTHGGVAVLDLAIPAPVTMTDGPVAVTALVDGAPVGDSGLLTLQVREPGASSFHDLAYFSFTT